MKPRKNTILILLLGLMLIAFAVGIAQTPAQGDQKQKAEACCSMDTCCCNNGSCPMKDGAANADAKDACCCDGDSCDMKAKDGKNHAEHADCCGDSCDMKNHDGKNHGTKDSCCKMKHKEKTKQKAA